MKSGQGKLPKLLLQVVTWDKDSHGLFDYEMTKNMKEYFQIQGPCKVFRNWLTTSTCLVSNDKIKRGLLPDESFTFLASIVLKHNGNFDQFFLNAPEKPSQQIHRKESTADEVGPINTNTYIIIKHFKSNNRTQGYPIKSGNVVKLGRVEFKVVEVGGISKHKSDNKQKSFLGEFNGFHNADEIKTGTCKFCLGDDFSQDNYLISPCNCKGSCEGVHVQCLKMWIDSKVKKQVSGMVVSYNFTKFECELCKTPFPRVVSRNQQRIEMITIDKPAKPYLILQGINQRKQSKQQRCLHVICPEQGLAVKIGRGHQCQIRLQDISVSRMHSQIRYFGGDFYLLDQNSKFGTLVKLDKQIELNQNVKLQIGRSVYQFSTN